MDDVELALASAIRNEGRATESSSVYLRMDVASLALMCPSSMAILDMDCWLAFQWRNDVHFENGSRLE